MLASWRDVQEIRGGTTGCRQSADSRHDTVEVPSGRHPAVLVRRRAYAGRA